MQVLHHQLQATRHRFLQPPDRECCRDCLRVRQRLAATCGAAAAWYEAFDVVNSQQLQAVMQGKPALVMPVPPYKLQLPEGVP